jgi:hypothetical protein
MATTSCDSREADHSAYRCSRMERAPREIVQPQPPEHRGVVWLKILAVSTSLR